MERFKNAESYDSYRLLFMYINTANVTNNGKDFLLLQRFALALEAIEVRAVGLDLKLYED